MAVRPYNQQISFAAEFALRAHLGQVRKYTGEPYYNHLAAVSNIVADVGGTDDMIITAYLHDVLEDTPVTPQMLELMFGPKITRWVGYLTNVSKETGINREGRKLLDGMRLGLAPPEVKTIKLADLIDNTSSIVQHDPKFAKTYMAEKMDLLPFLDSGHPDLHFRASKIVSDYYAAYHASLR